MIGLMYHHFNSHRVSQWRQKRKSISLITLGPLKMSATTVDKTSRINSSIGSWETHTPINIKFWPVWSLHCLYKGVEVISSPSNYIIAFENVRCSCGRNVKKKFHYPQLESLQTNQHQILTSSESLQSLLKGIAVILSPSKNEFFFVLEHM